MIDGERVKRVQIKPFNNMWYKFLITYGSIGVFFFLSINAVLDNIFKNYSDLFVSDLPVDGSDFSIFVNLFVAPFFLLIFLFNIIVLLLFEYIVIRLFKSAYFNSMVKDDERGKLNRYVKIAICCFILANITGVILFGDIRRTILFVLLYLPIPIFTYIHFCLKIKRAGEDYAG